MNQKIQITIQNKPFQISSLDDFLLYQQAMYDQCSDMEPLDKLCAQSYLLELGNSSSNEFSKKLEELKEYGIKVIEFFPNDNFYVNPTIESTPYQ